MSPGIGEVWETSIFPQRADRDLGFEDTPQRRNAKGSEKQGEADGKASNERLKSLCLRDDPLARTGR